MTLVFGGLRWHFEPSGSARSWRAFSDEGDSLLYEQSDCPISRPDDTTVNGFSIPSGDWCVEDAEHFFYALGRDPWMQGHYLYALRLRKCLWIV